MTTRTWTGHVGSWFNAADWSPSGIPASGDTASLSSGLAQLGSGAVLDGIGIVLGGLGASLSGTDATFGAGTAISVGGTADSFSFTGVTRTLGTIAVSGSLNVTGGANGAEAGEFDNEGQVAIGAGATVSILSGALTNNGTIRIAGGSLAAYGPTNGSGTIELAGQGGTQASLDIRQSLSGGVLQFDDGNGLLHIGVGAGVTAGLRGFRVGDQIDVGQKLSSVTVANGVLALGQSHLTLLGGSYSASDFSLADDGQGGTLVTTTHAAGSGAVATDVNGDGMSDIMLRGADGTVALWEMNGTTLMGGGGVGNPGTAWHPRATGDFNGDGRADIVLQNTDGTVAVWEMSGTALTGGGGLGNPGAAWQVEGTGDFDGDGHADILLQNTDGTVAIWEMNGTSLVGGGGVGNPGPGWQIRGVGDFNADGRSDIVLQNTDGTVAIWEMNGTTLAGGGGVGNPGAAWQVKGTGDFDGDGHSDILLQNTDGTVALWDMNGTSLVGGGGVGNPGPGWQIRGTGDYNGDGRSDILLQNTDGTVALWEMNGTSLVGGGGIGNPGSAWSVIGTDAGTVGSLGTGSLASLAALASPAAMVDAFQVAVAPNNVGIGGSAGETEYASSSTGVYTASSADCIATHAFMQNG